MAEWHVSGQYQQQRHPAVAPQAGGGGVEWYSAGAGSQYAASSYSYDVPGAQSAAAFGSFEEEPPLLEGEHARQPALSWAFVRLI